MEAIADHVIGLLGSLAAKELELLCNFQDDLETMERKMKGIRAVLRDAEKKATKTDAISDWLQKLKYVLLDAEDLLDAYLADELAREVMTKGKMAKEVRTFFSKSNRIVCAHKIGRKIRAIMKKLDKIYNEKNPSLLFESSSSTSNESHEWRLTDPFVSEQDVIGRDDERKHLVSTLLNPDMKSDVSVVPIVGIGGSGKTTLAQLVYNDVAIKNHFELMMWVCVSDETQALSNKMLAQKIIGGQQTSAQLDPPVAELSRKVEGKRFLLVLDDVWNINDRGEWLQLQNVFRGGRKGSMIIVTTRSMEVEKTMGTYPPFQLEGLHEDKSWELFCSMAFRDGIEPDDQEFVGIGKDIVRKCGGVALAIITIGSVLFRKGLKVREWSYMRDQELVNIGSDDNRNKKILSILKLSYDYLPSHLKNCFALCSLFPKDYEIERKLLIQMWIAEGFIQSLDTNRVLEDVGDEYFMQLLSRCLFQNVKRDSLGEIKSCKMHDLIHDLALSITKNESYIVTSEKIEENIGDAIRNLSSHFNGAWEFQFGNVKTKRVRTILSQKGQCYFIHSRSPLRFFNPIFRSTTSLPKHLRVLVLTNERLEIPKSIGSLKHLRYLDLSGNLKLKKLPQGITKVHNLLSLRLYGCKNLIQLPKDMKKLIRLRHLELDLCVSLTSLPQSIGSLTSLQELSLNFCTALTSLPGSIGSLKSLQRLSLNNCTALTSLPDSIGSLKSLQGLSLNFCTVLTSLLDSIGSLKSLRGLSLNNCTALTSLLDSIGSLKSLQGLSLNFCSALTSLPDSIGCLKSLHELSLIDCPLLALLPESIGSLTSLQKLTLKSWPSLAALPESIGSLISLKELSLGDCTSLAPLPESIGSLTSLEELSVGRCTSLASLPESIGSLTSLKELSLDGCTSLASVPESIRSLTSLKELSLDSCTSLASFPEFIGSLTSLKELSLGGYTSLASVPESIGSLTSLKELILDDCTSLA
ncbi:hypothetical protein QN277_002180 [Acacia crassicarpa]|uniref:Disease resistance protein RGA3 n=1 Tax=Acacia crassicarpa TaxID=499986 RepID=A0AAE1N8Y5_9FABA|nr:hypothetical protein QN277_002180 [Acacia crassicarpa]